MVATYNPITGCKRRAARRDLSRKKRSSQSSTVASRMYSEKALKEYHHCLLGCRMHLAHLVILVLHGDCNQQVPSTLAKLLLIFASMRMLAAIKMLLLDAELMDLHDNDLNNSGFCKPIVDVTLDSFADDDECEAKT